ncbi:MAG: ECF transporter S component [Candidatus Thorarchaeota archaeon]|jgi:riboflavin transporter FmnP
MEMTNILTWIIVIVIVVLGFALRRYVSNQKITVKQIAFVGIMSALGTVLAVVSFVPIGPGVHIDFSHIGTFIVAIALGPFYGMITGALIGIYPMTVFGNPLVIIGKALTGLFIGLLIQRARLVIGLEGEKKAKFLRIIPTTIVGWLPEALFTFVTLGIIGIPVLFPIAVVQSILVKGAAEIVLLGILCEILFASKALQQAMTSLQKTP